MEVLYVKSMLLVLVVCLAMMVAGRTIDFKSKSNAFANFGMAVLWLNAVQLVCYAIYKIWSY